MRKVTGDMRETIGKLEDRIHNVHNQSRERSGSIDNTASLSSAARDLELANTFHEVVRRCMVAV